MVFDANPQQVRVELFDRSAKTKVPKKPHDRKREGGGGFEGEGLSKECAFAAGTGEEFCRIEAFADHESDRGFKRSEAQDHVAFFFKCDHGLFMSAAIGVDHAKHVPRVGAVSTQVFDSCDSGNRPGPLEARKGGFVREQIEY